MTKLIIIAILWLLILHYIAYQLLTIWKKEGGNLRLGLATSIFMVNGQVAGFLFNALIKGGDL